MTDAALVTPEEATEIDAKVRDHYQTALAQTERMARRLDAESTLRARAKTPSDPPPAK